MTKHTKFIAAICILLFVALLSNPSADRHREQINSSVSERSPLAGLLGLGVITAFVSNYHTLGIASYTRIQGTVVSVGFLGMVFVLDAQKDVL